MSHIVIHDDNDKITQYRQFEDVQAAAAYLEALHNHDGITGARLYALDEVAFAVRSYVKVEIGAFAPDPTATPRRPVVFDDADTAAAETSDHGEPFDEHDAMDVFASSGALTADDYLSGSEVRRGLFGR